MTPSRSLADDIEVAAAANRDNDPADLDVGEFDPAGPNYGVELLSELEAGVEVLQAGDADAGDVDMIALNHVSLSIFDEGLFETDADAPGGVRPRSWIADAIDDVLATEGLTVTRYTDALVQLDDDDRDGVTQVVFGVECVDETTVGGGADD